jgi:murein L,D-transpeptidase YafK
VTATAKTGKQRTLALAVGMMLFAIPSWNATVVNADSNLPAGFHKTSFGKPRSVEGLLAQSLLQITRGQTDAALATIDSLLNIVPNFKLAHLVRGDLLMARSHELAGFGSVNDAPQDAIIDFQEEARVRLQRYLAQQDAQPLPEYLWRLDPEYAHAIVVDTAKSRLYLYRNDNGTPRYIADYYITVGKNGVGKQKEGDKRTPEGIYFAGKQLQRKLPDFYGSGAFPLNYPNEWDKRQGKNGHGIWLHGTPGDTYSRPPRASDGCIVLANPDLDALKPYLKNGSTPVIIARDAQLVPDTQLTAQKTDLLREIESWRQAWQAQETERYLDFYSRDFFTKNHDFDRWAAEKRRKQATAVPAEITLSNISVFRYPNDQQEMVVVNFEQEYKSNNLDDRVRKRQYWVLENKRWKILYEGTS